MWVGIENAISRVDTGGKLFVAIYNDQGWKSHLWWFVKFFYNRLPHILKRPFVVAVMGVARLLVAIKDGRVLNRGSSVGGVPKAREARGMSAQHDAIDWVGGFPYEFATFETLTAYLRMRGFSIVNANRNTSWGCSELVLKRTSCAD
jgi:2-polyprenyl-6-hydroxyphenyl methylase/3-demethylubiquinone-9 3-methyltransferase